MSQSEEVIAKTFEGFASINLDEKLGSCSLDHETETPPNYKAKTFHEGDVIYWEKGYSGLHGNNAYL